MKDLRCGPQTSRAEEGRLQRVKPLGFQAPPRDSLPTAPVAKTCRPQSETRNPETRANWALRRIPAQSRLRFHEIGTEVFDTDFPKSEPRSLTPIWIEVFDTDLDSIDSIWLPRRNLPPRLPPPEDAALQLVA